jgi:hypothetical protein
MTMAGSMARLLPVGQPKMRVKLMLVFVPAQLLAMTKLKIS